MSNEPNNEQARVLNEEELKGVNGGLYVDKLTVKKSDRGTEQWESSMGSDKLIAGQYPGFAIKNEVHIGDVLPIVG